MTRHARLPVRRHAAALVAPALAALRRLPPPSARLWLVAPTALEVALVVALVLFHVLSGLLGALGAQGGRHD